MLQSAIMLFKGHLPLLFQALFCPCQAVLFWTGNSDRKPLFKQRFGDKGQTRWDDVSTPSLRHGEVLCLCIPQCGIFSFSLLLILSLFAVVLCRGARKPDTAPGRRPSFVLFVSQSDAALTFSRHLSPGASLRFQANASCPSPPA